MVEEGKSLKLSIVIEIMIQSFANCGVVAVPLIVIAFDQTQDLYTYEVLFFLCFWFSIVFETIADVQKKKFISLKSRSEGKPTSNICNIGLW
jgi:steroid 5-alpha reductase family enzyme